MTLFAPLWVTLPFTCSMQGSILPSEQQIVHADTNASWTQPGSSTEPNHKVHSEAQIYKRPFSK